MGLSNLMLMDDMNHMVWAGDFNRHHLLWDNDKDTHLFTQQALWNAEGIIDLIAEFDMEMTLPKQPLQSQIALR